MSSPPFKNIAIVGGGGNVGSAIIAALIANPHGFNITVLTRFASISTSTFHTGITVKTVPDYETLAPLVEALKNQDVLICALNDNATSLQLPLIHAALLAGVRRFIPSEFASNEWTSPVPELEPLIASKAAVRDLLVLKVKEAEGEAKEFHWTAINAGFFFDWCLHAGIFGIDLVEKKATVWNSGDSRLSMTNLGTVIQAIVSILSSSFIEMQTRDRFITIESFAASQNDILTAIEKNSGEKWSLEKTTTEVQYETARNEWNNGEYEKAYIRWLMGSVYVEREGWPFPAESVENELLGLPKETLEQSLGVILKTQT